MIDYGGAAVYNRAKEEKKRKAWEGTKLPRNPMDYFWNYSLDDFGYWIPLAWDGDRKLKQEWLMKEFGGQKAFRYEPPRKKLELAPVLASSY